MANKAQSYRVEEEYHNKNVVITDKDGAQERVILSTSMNDQEIRNAVEKGVPILHFGGDVEKLARFQIGRKEFQRKLNKNVTKTTLAAPKDGIMPVFAKKEAIVEVSDANKIKILIYDLSVNAGLSREDAVAKATELIKLKEDELEPEKELLKVAFEMKRWSADKAFNKIHGK